MGEHLLEPKAALRTLFRGRRRAVAAAEISAASAAICDRIRRLIVFRDAVHVVAYCARADEVDPWAAAEIARRDGKAVYVPRVVGAGLEFRAGSADELRPGSYGIPEPSSGPVLAPGAPGVLFLVPGLAFDPNGVRLGRGGGHYDRALADFEGARRLGLALDGQLAADLPTDPWDQHMDAVVTQRRLLWSAAPRNADRKEDPQ